MKDVLISIRPQWVEKIASGEKTIEVRKTAPKLETPFKCLIYCTIARKNGQPLLIYKDGTVCFGDYRNACNFNANGEVDCYIGERYLIGEFICDRIICTQAYFDSQGKNHLTNIFPEDIKRTCLTEYEMWNYIAGKAVKANETYDGWLWHISDLKIYERPKELKEFTPVCKYEGERCDICCFNEELFGGCFRTLSRPPQSWCYVEGE